MLRIVNPANETVIRELEEDSSAAIAAKFKRARDAQPGWARRPLQERLECIRRFGQILRQRKEELARILTAEMGKPILQARNELNAVHGRIDYFLENFESVTREQGVWLDQGSGLEERITHEPLGVVANISAWNYPYFVGANVFVPALLAGNTVLYKPSEHAALTGLEIARAMHEAGVPEDVFVPVIGAGAAGAEILRQPVQGVFFTGSYATGARVAESAARRMIRAGLELGGKDPVYVCDDVEIRAAAEAIADGAFYNTGQSCCSVERIYVHQAIYDSFVEAFMRTVEGFAAGDPMDERTYIGPLARAAQLETLERQVSDAAAKGARLLRGGRRMKRVGFFFEPTVLVDANHSMLIMREETFGPVIGIQPVASDAEALRLINDTEYGLTCSVYSKDRKRAEQVLAQAAAGTVYWNCCDRVSPRLPWSGRGHSGIGSTLSTYGIQAFVQPKAWHLRLV